MGLRTCAVIRQQIHKLGVKQLLRFVLLIACTIIVVIQLSDCFYKLKYPPVSTHTKTFFNDSLYYPALTVCRQPAYKTQVLKEYNLGEDITWTSEWKNFPSENKTLNDFWNEATYTVKEMTQVYGLFGKQIYVEIIDSLHFNNGRCITFKPLIVAPMTGEEYGFIIILTRKYDNDTSTSNKNGWNIYIHEVGEQWTEYSRASNRLENIFLGLKEEINVKITAKQFIRLNSAKNPCDKQPFYNINECEEECLTKRLLSKLSNCSAPWLHQAQHLPQCQTVNDIHALVKDYINDNYKQSGMKSLDIEHIEEVDESSNTNYVCNCYRKCHNTIYSVQVDSRKYYQTSLLKVFYSTNMITTIEERTGYDWTLFIADLGGSLGFLLGLSVLGIVGIFERIIDLCCCVIMFSEEPIREEKPDPPRINKKINIFNLHDDDYYSSK